MSDLIRGFTVEQYAKMTQGVMFEIRNCMVAVLYYSELATEKLDPSHPAFSPLAEVVRAGKRAFDTLVGFDREVCRRRDEAPDDRGEQP